MPANTSWPILTPAGSRVFSNLGSYLGYRADVSRVLPRLFGQLLRRGLRCHHNTGQVAYPGLCFPAFILSMLGTDR